jgi:N-acetylmuramoyl-L-alanine amidase
VPSKLILSIFISMIVAAQVLSSQSQPAQVPAEGQAVPQTANPSQPQAPPVSTPAPPPQPTPPQKSLALVIVDPAHGGADLGARGLAGFTESEIVLAYARLLRISLESQGLRVLLTRQSNDDPSFDDRSTLANAQRSSIFITLHVSSTGPPGTVRVYSLMQTPLPASSAVRGGLLPWDRAQFRFIEQSRKLAELIQIQMAQRFHGSSEIPLEAPTRQLRTVGAPAVAIEISSVSVSSRSTLDQMGPGLADGVARAVAAFRTLYEGSR